MPRGSRTSSTEPRSSDPNLGLCLLVYEISNEEFTLTTAPGLPIVPSSPFYQTLQDLWSQHGNRDAVPSIGLIRAVAADIQRRPRLWNYAIYRSWLDYTSDLHYVLLQSVRNGNGNVVEGLNSTTASISSGRRQSPRRNRFVRVVEQGYVADASSDEN